MWCERQHKILHTTGTIWQYFNAALLANSNYSHIESNISIHLQSCFWPASDLSPPLSCATVTPTPENILAANLAANVANFGSVNNELKGWEALL